MEFYPKTLAGSQEKLSTAIRSIEGIVEAENLYEVTEPQRIGGLDIEPDEDTNGIKIALDKFQGIFGSSETSWRRITVFPEGNEPTFEKAYTTALGEKPEWTIVGGKDAQQSEEAKAYFKNLIAEDILNALEQQYTPKETSEKPQPQRKIPIGRKFLNKLLSRP